ncbi:MAG: sialidase [Abditibacteriota bacterium]|nr:sialidase [Abditibacteriota bacterium]
MDDPAYKIISRGIRAGEYQAFSDACRLKNGDIVAVFYAGYGHVSYPNAQYPKSGWLCLVRSQDEGRTWSEPQVIYDDEEDNRDPHIAQLNDGTLICSFFSLRFPDPKSKSFKGSNPQVIRSTDNGKSWSQKATAIETTTPDWYCSAPVREMPDGTCLLPIYHQENTSQGMLAWGGVVRSRVRGLTWEKEVAVGAESKLILPAETDVVLLQDGSLLAALRGHEGKRTQMHSALSRDLGQTWSPVQGMGFLGHSPHFLRLSSGELLLTYRGFADDANAKGHYTALRVSRDDGKTWQGPYQIDSVHGAYPATVELKDGSILAIYYEEGPKSAVRALRFHKPIERPLPVTALPFN